MNHTDNHSHLVALIAAYLKEHGRMPRDTTVFELVEWSHKHMVDQMRKKHHDMQ